MVTLMVELLLLPPHGLCLVPSRFQKQMLPLDFIRLHSHLVNDLLVLLPTHRHRMRGEGRRHIPLRRRLLPQGLVLAVNQQIGLHLLHPLKCRVRGPVFTCLDHLWAVLSPSHLGHGPRDHRSPTSRSRRLPVQSLLPRRRSLMFQIQRTSWMLQLAMS